MKFILLTPVVIITALVTLIGFAIYFLFQPVISVLSNSSENELSETMSVNCNGLQILETIKTKIQ